MGRLDGKVAIVTGPGQGVGRGIALAYAKAGASVVLAGRTLSKVRDLEQGILALGGKAAAIRCDVADKADVYATTAFALEQFGAIDILVNNAFCGNDPMPLAETPDQYMQAAVNSNIFGTMHFMQACFPHMKEKGGSIINFASGAAIEGWAFLATYAATKEAIRGLSRSAAKEWGKFNIRVNIISPQANSPAMELFRQNQPDNFAALIAGTPLGYLGDCEEDIAPVAVFLASEDSRYMTGHTLNVDGGSFVLR